MKEKKSCEECIHYLPCGIVMGFIKIDDKYDIVEEDDPHKFLPTICKHFKEIEKNAK